MPKVKFGKKDEPAVTLEKSVDLIAVRTRSTRSLRAGPVLSSNASELADSELVLSFPDAGVEVYKVPAQKRTVDKRKKALRMSTDVRFAGSVLVDKKSGEPMIYTENIFIKFVDDADPEQCVDVILKAGLTIKREVKYAANAYFVEAPEGTGTEVFDIALKLLDRDDVEYCHPEIVRKRSHRSVFDEQWHLKTTLIGQTSVTASANVEAAHSSTKGNGITIAIIDDGVDIEHIEFRSLGKIVAPRDVTFNNDNPRPKFSNDNHGTACAGVACADGIDGASGVAPEAKLMPIRLAFRSWFTRRS